MGFQRHNVKNGSRAIGKDGLTNRMLTGGTHTIFLKGNTAGEKDFEAGKVLENETIHVDMDGTNGLVYNTSTDLLQVKLGTTSTVNVVNMYGESTAFTDDCFLKGTKVVISSNTYPRFNGTYTMVDSRVVSTNCFIDLAADAPNSYFGDADLSAEPDDLNATSADNKVSVTVLPFPPAFCVEMLAVDGQTSGTDDARTTPVTMRMNNSAGARESAIDYPDGTVIYGEITHFTPEATANHYAILYTQDVASLEYSPYNRGGILKGASGKSNPVAR